MAPECIIHNAYREIIGRLLRGETDTHSLKTQIARKYGLQRLPTNPEVLSAASPQERGSLLPVLRIKPTRSLSGVSVVAVMTPPHSCPHGRCAYCPNVPGVPNSYTGREPSAMRGLQNQYDPHMQVQSRIAQLRSAGHQVSKVELIVQGGTFPATSPDSQCQFVKGCFDALTGVISETLPEAQANAEQSRVRNVGLTFETRPDHCQPEDIDHMLDLGVTRVELGVQTVYDDVYQLVERGHSVEHVVDATRRLKDAGLKVCYHMMPGLPGSSPDRDISAFRALFDDPSFRPDMIKIYPCLVLEGTKIHEWWRLGEYQPLTTSEAVELLSEVKDGVPFWVRIMRVQRDIPAQLIIAGVKKSNLRQLIREYMGEHGLACHCIRCREVGHLKPVPSLADKDIRVKSTRYVAGDGTEFFISAEDEDESVLVAYLRLRMPSLQAHRSELKKRKSAHVRELHVYGSVVPVDESQPGAWQHRGYGKALLREAEHISKENGAEQVLVMSAVGVRDYFRRQGYKRVGPYMGKTV
ncbi:tRNA uridine(34) 5-carboxymethylaminomethyl modification radical SAM/GNAT enzyme Elp3 [Candidatus Bathyarchaeota archaeon]|nr:tRNA uridine(34) 5-carboxymethylaminomethyl modification radical SAM/GNAT enzyme Elp3 [Candidatus Bathyarchaeota archaeon]